MSIRIVNTSKPDLTSYTLYSDDGARAIGWVEAQGSDNWTWHTIFGTSGEHADRSEAIIACSRSCEHSRGKGKKGRVA